MSKILLNIYLLNYFLIRNSIDDNNKINLL